MAFATYWISTIYIFEFGYPKTHFFANISLAKEIDTEIRYITNEICIYAKAQTNSTQLDCKKQDEILKFSATVEIAPASLPDSIRSLCVNHNEADRNIHGQLLALINCSEHLAKERNKMEIYADTRKQDIRPPFFGLPKIQLTDLSPIGNLTVTILATWMFFAARRENHALLTFVDFDQHTRRNSTLFPTSVTLCGQDNYISAEHLCYAYQAISQRFLIIASSHSNPSRVAIILLTTFAPLTASINLIIDFRDAFSFPAIAFRSFALHLFFNSTLVVLIWIITTRTLIKQIETSTLLNSWYIAVRDVWMEEWDESNEERASPVRVDIGEQTGKKAGPPQPGLSDSGPSH
ncbi:hypothetical protein [Methyloversatilis thermotolerans]|uniref:hypothetical protein n=1 Tax=Methyloversatilis thermotolerans TaxID=1346290 RepID=UPI0012F99749|nr:hypothetical protein [Methyloversatilis thermotolerans]